MSDPMVLATEVINLRAPKYSGDQRIPQLLVLAEEFMGSKIPNTTPREYAKALQVLHWLELSDRADVGSGATGSVQIEKEGDLSIKYSNPMGNLMHYTTDMKAELFQTIWGLELYAFVKRYFVPVMTRFS